MHVRWKTLAQVAEWVWVDTHLNIANVVQNVFEDHLIIRDEAFSYEKKLDE